LNKHDLTVHASKARTRLCGQQPVTNHIKSQKKKKNPKKSNLPPPLGSDWMWKQEASEIRGSTNTALVQAVRLGTDWRTQAQLPTSRCGRQKGFETRLKSIETFQLIS